MNRASVDGSGAGRGTFKSYATGFLLSVILTLIPFTLVMYGALARPALLASIFGAAAVQIAVHLHYFLHLDRSSRARWNVWALLLASLIMILIIGGTMWIMYHLHQRLI